MKEETKKNLDELTEIWIKDKSDGNKYSFEIFLTKKLNKRKIPLKVIETFIKNEL